MSFWDFFWLMVWGMFFILYLIVLFHIIVDIFRSKMNGWFKAIWVIALFIFPAITALIYIIANGKGMYEREAAANAESRAAAEDYIRSVASTDSATQIANAKALLDSGAITQAEFDKLKTKALA